MNIKALLAYLSTGGTAPNCKEKQGLRHHAPEMVHETKKMPTIRTPEFLF
jgi:hypothetical protein